MDVDVEIGAASVASSSERFPPEVLALIFESLRPSRSKLPSGKLMHSDDNTLLSIVHVCKFWREVAFSHAILWASEVDVSAHPHPNMTAIVLGKSGSQPLDVKLHYVTEEYDQVVLAMWFTDPYRSRIRSLDVETTGVRAMRRLIKVIGSELPSLRSLKLLNEAEQDPDLMNGLYEEPPAMALPRLGLLQIRRARALERIELRDYLLPWTSPHLFARVTHLELHVTAEEPSNHLPTHSQLHAVITVMQSLETLILDDVFPVYSGVRPGSPIPLPSTCRSVVLRACHYHGNCRDLLSALRFPTECSLTIDQVCREREDAEEADVITMLAGSQRRPQVASVKTDPFEQLCGEFSVAYDASAYLSSPEKLLHSPIVPAPHVTFQFEVTTQTIEQEDWDEEDSKTVSYDRMQTAITHVNLSDLLVLRIDEMREADEFHLCNGMDAYHGERTTPILDTAENVKILVLADTSLHILMFLENPSDMTGKLVLPRLETVVVPESTKSYSANSLKGYFAKRAEQGLSVPAVRAPQSLSDTSFAQDLGENVTVTYF
ncbi:unnamed protein product [Peniophora sp. CBMAI 1063]|nr:unnamed protein product [Peniophora sp. CBMAI 1063]